MRLFFILVLFLSNMSFLSGQKVVDENTNGWYMYFGDNRLTERLSVHTEYQARRNDIYKYWQQSLIRLGVNFHFDSWPLLTGGFTTIRTWPYGSQPAALTNDELNFFEQVTLQQSYGRFQLQHRYRLEQRWIGSHSVDETFDLLPEDANYLNRLRYRLLAMVPLNGKLVEPGTIYVSVFDEIWINFGGHVKYNIFDQNWIYAALGYKFNQEMNLECGYMNQYLLKADGLHAENNHTLMVSWFYNIDFRQGASE